jgi:energy-coupling factor transporter ATP-binding protein EcfA2
MTKKSPNQEHSIPTITRTIQAPYDYNYLLQYVEHHGRNLYGDDFAIHDCDRPVVRKLLAYFLQDEAAAASQSIDLTKGILLAGRVGCGKTTLMNIMRTISAEAFKPAFRSCREIAMEFSQQGYEVITRYSRKSFFPYSHVPRSYCFDDLGLECTVQYWGNTCNVMAEILLSRYDLFISHNMITHATTNLVSEELEASYGSRVRSRMRSMFNFISFDKQTSDKRK